MTKGKWIEYTGSDEQIEEMCKPGCIYAVMDVSGKVFGPYVWFDTSNHPDPRLREFNDLKSQLNTASIKQYLICEPHPYADIIKIWADTGCEVYAKHKKTGQTDSGRSDRVDWNHEEWEFSLTPFED